MFTFSNFMLVGFGAAIGAWLRWLITYFLSTVDPSLPHGTLVVNLIGGLIIGISFAAIQSTSIHVSEEIKLILNVGFLGAFTTFSTFSLQAFDLIQHERYLAGGIYIVSSVVISLLAIGIGMAVAKQF